MQPQIGGRASMRSTLDGALEAKRYGEGLKNVREKKSQGAGEAIGLGRLMGLLEGGHTVQRTVKRYPLSSWGG
jgi:hypothetical protein